MKWNLFGFRKWREPARRPLLQKPFLLEELEPRLLFSVNVLTYGYGNGNEGVNNAETQLTPASLSSGAFGKRFSTPVDGQVYAQPLVDTSVTINNGPNTTPGAAGVHDVVFVATENDSLYAIDASPSSNGAVLWQRSFLDANDPNDALPGATSVTAVPSVEVNPPGSTALVPLVGITSTPVIDPNTNLLFVIVTTKEIVGGVTHYVQRLHAINLSDGTDATSPYLIGDTSNGNDNNTSIYVAGTGDGSVPNPYNTRATTVVQFNAMHEYDRAALTLVNDTIYAEFASHDTEGPYHGWILSWNVANVGTNGFQLSGVFNDSPNAGGAGIWQGGGPIAFTPDGSSFYVETGNGTEYDGNTAYTSPVLNSSGFPIDGYYPESVLQIAPDPAITPQNPTNNGWGFEVLNYFMPYDVVDLSDNNKDLASGPALLPSSAGIPGHPDLLISGGKAGQIYVLDANDLGGYSPDSDSALNSVSNGDGIDTPPQAVTSLLSTPTYFNGELYVSGGYDDYAYAYTINPDGTLTVDSQTSQTLGLEPASPVISANGTSNAIAWIVDRNSDELQAYDPSNLEDELWSSGQGANALGSPIKFALPTVANGMVFVGTDGSLAVYGLTQADAVSQAPTLSATALSGTSVNLSWQDASQLPNVASVYQIEESTDGVNFTQVTTAPQGATSLDIGGLTPGTTYWFRILGTNNIGDSPYSNVATATTTATSQAPATPSASSATAASANSVLVSWTNTSTNQTGYFLDRATDPGFTQNLITETLPASANNFTDTANGLLPGGTYYYRLRAFNAAGSSSNTTPFAVTIPYPPPAPSNPILTATSNSIQLSWTDNAGALASGYLIYRTSSHDPFALQAILPSGSTSWLDTNVTPNTSYLYQIVSFNVSGSNGYINVSGTSLPLTVPPGSAPMANGGSSVFQELFSLELDAFLLANYITLASKNSGQGANLSSLNSEILSLWSVMLANPQLHSSMGLEALEQGFSLAHSSSHS